MRALTGVQQWIPAVREDSAHPKVFTVSGPVLADAGPRKYF